MDELVFRSISETTHADWLVNGPATLDQSLDWSNVSFDGKIFELMLINFKQN